MQKELDEFWRDYNSAMNNPAPLDDGGTAPEEIERLLDRATDLLDILELRYMKDQTK